MKKRPYSQHYDADLRHSVESFSHNTNKLAYYVLIGYLNGTNSDKGWALWKESTIIKICYLDRRSVKKFMDSEEVKNKLIFGYDKIGDLWCSHSRTQSDLNEFYAKYPSEGYAPKLLNLCTNPVQSVYKLGTKCVQSGGDKSLNNNIVDAQPITKPITKPSIYSLAQAQEIQDYQNHEIEGETPEQKKDLDEAYDALCQGEDGSKKRLEVISPISIPKIEDAKAWAEYHYQKLDFDVWYKHWESIDWIDSNGSRIEWKRKMAYNAKQPMFMKKEEKSQTIKAPLKTFKEKDEENSERTFLLLEVGFQYKEKTTEELKEMVKQKRENDFIIAEQKREGQLAQIEAKKNEVVQIAPVKIKTQAELDADYLYELRRDYGGAFANANKTLEEMLEIKRKKEEERNRPVKWFDQAKIEQAPTLDASLRDLYGNLLHNY